MPSGVVVRGRKLADIARKLIDHSVTVGIHSDEPAYPSGERVQQVAAWNEYGTDTAPERSFLRSTLHKRRKKYFSVVRTLAGNAIAGNDRIPDGMRRLGELAKSDVRQTVVEMTSPPNAPSTIARKGRNDPLIDTRHMLTSIESRDAR